MSLKGKTTDVKLPSENGFTSGLSDASAFSETLKRPFAHLHHVPLQLRAAFNNSNAQAAISSKMPSSIQMISNPAGQSKLTTRFTTEELYEELRRRIYLEREQTDELHACSGSLPRVGIFPCCPHRFCSLDVSYKCNQTIIGSQSVPFTRPT